MDGEHAFTTLATLKDDELETAIETANCGAVLMVWRDDLDGGCNATDTHVGFVICNRLKLFAFFPIYLQICGQYHCIATLRTLCRW